MSNYTIYIVCLEPIDSRYTKQWYDNIPKLIEQRDTNKNVEIVTVAGDDIPATTTTGAFLDFAATNYYKSTQAAKISSLFMNGKVKAGDKFLVTDSWNFVITPIKYMSDLLDIPVEIHGIWHAGAYDPSDILGMKMSKHWPAETERSWFYACDYNYYATDFHKNMFLKNLNIPVEHHHKAITSGQPHELIVQDLEPGYTVPKQRQIIWPHRYNADKQPEIAESIADIYPVVITQKMNLSKAEYYKVLSESSVIFSCSLHENLGISIMEAVLSGVIPILPDRCSYTEMYSAEFLYPSEWTSSYDNFIKYKNELYNFIDDRLNNPEKYAQALLAQRDRLKAVYMSSDVMMEILTNGR